MDTIREPIAETPVRRIAKLPPARRAGAAVGWDQREAARQLQAAQDGEACFPLRLDARDTDRGNLRQ